MPSDITCSVSETLSGKTIVVGVTGSIAAVRVVDLIRDLIRRGAEVHCGLALPRNRSCTLTPWSMPARTRS